MSITIPNIILKKIIGYIINFDYIPLKYKISLSVINRCIFDFISNYFSGISTFEISYDKSSDNEKKINGYINDITKHLNLSYCILKKCTYLKSNHIVRRNETSLWLNSPVFQNLEKLSIRNTISTYVITNLNMLPNLKKFHYINTAVEQDISNVNISHLKFPALVKFKTECNRKNIPVILALLKGCKDTLKYIDITIRRFQFKVNVISPDLLIQYLEDTNYSNQYEFISVMDASKNLLTEKVLENHKDSLKYYRLSRHAIDSHPLFNNFVQHLNALTSIDIYYFDEKFLNRILEIPLFKPTLKKIKLSTRNGSFVDPYTNNNENDKLIWPQFDFVETLVLRGTIKVIKEMLISNYHCTSLKYLNLHYIDFIYQSLLVVKELDQFLLRNKSLEKLKIQIDNLSEIEKSPLYKSLLSHSNLRHLKIKCIGNVYAKSSFCELFKESKSINIISFSQIHNYNQEHLEDPIKTSNNTFNISLNLPGQNQHSKVYYCRGNPIQYSVPTPQSPISNIFNTVKSIFFK
ncbi:hypothetical protein DLAC_02228 [Tieghemostelium lacteum]|uniref:Uncharacterized protein n=1 Tax=Tieghemostelium lacteum TaxID=361077 RepID=A0A152A4Y8_TIELA|nr:hypothetical protein DLAC_02228 [Tieghemostelium lacteum]|eukprot:KYR01125.1 hypothetical protein DLAC_02228 [Tieghemostelium lacteum]